jgi:hypothetical protein
VRSLSVIYFLLITSILVWIGCNDDNSTKKVGEIRSEGPISNIVRNPVTADGPIDTINIAKIQFDQLIYTFGSVKEGTVVKQSFSFTNTGRVPLLINDCRSTCGCTVPEWPKKAIMPGESGSITVQFNTEGRKYDQDRPVTIIANTYPKNTIIRLQGFVEPK